MPIKRKILWVSLSQQDLTKPIKLIESTIDTQIIHQSAEKFESLLAIARNAKYDLILVCATEDHETNANEIKTLLQSIAIPVILLLNNPTVEQAVDMMNAGVIGVVDWRDTDRIIKLINRTFTSQSAAPTEAIFQDIVDHQTEFICRYDRDLRLIFVNHAYCELQGLSAEELVGTSIVEKIPDADREQAVAHVKALSIDNPVAVSVHSSLLPDGTVKIIEWTDRAIFNESGEIQEYQGVGRDVSERERITEALLASEEKYRTLVESSEAVIVVVDEAGELYFANEITGRQMQMEVDAIIGKNMYDLFPPSVVDYQLKLVKDVLRTGKGTVHEAPMPVAGGVHWFRTSFQPMRNGAGTVDKVLVNSADITQFKDAETSLRQSEEQFRSIYQQSPLAIQIYDKEANLTDVNQRTLELYGIDDKTYLLGYNMWSDPHLTAEHQNALKNGHAVTVSTSLDFETVKEANLFPTNKSGIMYFDIYVIPLVLDSEMVGYLAQMVDLTERNQAQANLEKLNQELEQMVKDRTKALEQTKDHIEAIFNHSADGILLLDDGLKIQQGNYAFEQMFAIPADTYLNKSLSELMSDEDHTRIASQLEDVIERHETKRLEIQAKHQGGTNFDAEISISPINRSDTTVENIVCIIRDITERKEYEQQLKYHARLQDNVSDAVIVTDTDFLIQSWNKAAERIYGWTEEEVVGIVTVQILRTEFSGDGYEQSRQQLQEQGWWQGEVIQHHKDGRTVHILGSITLIKDETGNPFSVIAVNRDITERKEYERQLHYHASLQENVNDAVIVMDMNFTIQSWNKAAERIYGWTEEEALGKSSIELSRVKMSPEEIADVINLLYEQGWWQGGVTHYHKDDTELDVWTSLTLIKDDNGNPFGVITVNSDISERKEYERQLHYHASLQDNVNDAVIVTDMEFVIQSWNKAAERIYGWTKDEVIGKLSTEVLRPEMPPEEIERSIQHLQAHGWWSGESIQHHRDGHIIYVLGSVTLIKDETGNPFSVIAVNRNITERKEYERQLKYHASLQENVNDAVIVMDMNFTIQSWNKAAERIYGWTKDEVIGKLTTEVLRPEMSPEEMEKSVQHIQTQGWWSSESIQHHRDGHIIYILGSGTLIKDEAGSPFGVIAINRDISDRKAHERQMQYNASLQKSMSDAVFVTDMEFTIQSWNKAAEVIYGWTAEEAIGIHANDILQNELSEDRHQLYFGQLTEQGWLELDVIQHHKDGRSIYIRSSMTLIKDELENPTSILYVNHDVTVRKQAEIALRESEARYQRIVNLSEEAILLTDADARITYVNPTWTRLTGYPEEETLGQEYFEFLTEANREPARKRFQDKKVGKTFRLDTQIVRKDGTSHWVLASANPIMSPEGDFQGILAMITDIDLRKQVEIALATSLETERDMQEYLTALHNISLKLAQTDTLDEFYRVTVSEGLSQLGFERMGFLLFDETDGSAVGTYGTDAEGNIVAEHQLRLQPDSLTGILQQTLEKSERFAVVRDTQLYANLEPIGIGENAAAALWHDKVLGWLAIDNGVNYEPISETQLDALALYALTVGSQLAIKQAELSLRESETRFRQLINAAPIATVVTDQNGYIHLVNQRAEELFGYDRSELIGEAVEILVPELVRTRHVEHRRSYIAEPHVREMGADIELYARRKDGSLFPTEIQLSYVDTPDGIMVMSYVIDITERKRAEAELDRNRIFLQTVIDASPSMIFVKDIEGRFVFVNPAMAAFFDMSVDALMAKSDADLKIPPHEVDRFHDADRRVIVGRETLSLEEGLTLKTGETRWLQTSKVPLSSEDGESVHVLGISTDITARKQAVIALEQALIKEKELSKMKSSFVATASHQFRTPLAAILATTETLTNYWDRLDADKITARLDRIRSQVDRMRGLMDDVLELSRIQANQVRYKPEQADLDGLCRDIIDDFINQQAYRGRIVYEGTDSPLTTIFDPHLMHHIISNTIHNALKYSSVEEKIVVSLSMVDQEIEFRVQDHGIGIPEADIKNLFIPFSRAENVESIEGTGLGLSIVKQSVEAHDGTINVESEVGVGTTFIVKIPHRGDEIIQDS